MKDKFRISECDLPYRKRYESQFTQQIFRTVAFARRKPPTYSNKNDQEETERDNFFQKELIKLFHQCYLLQESWFLMHPLNYFQTKNSALLRTFCRSN